MIVKIKVHPNSGEEKIQKKEKNSFEVWLKEKAEKGKANKRLFTLLQEKFPEKRILLLKGGKKTNKIIKIT